MKKITISIILLLYCVVLFILVKVLFLKKSTEIIGNKVVTFKLEKVYGTEREPKETMLSRVYGLEMDSNKNIYFLDGGSRLVSLNKDGSFRWQFNKNGSGPGDILNANGLATDGAKYLYLSNINGTRIDKIDLNGNFISSINTGHIKQTHLSVVGYIQPNLLVTSKPIWGGIGYEIFILDLDKNYSIRNQFIIDRTNGLKLLKNGSLGFDIGVFENNIIAGNVTSYRLVFYNVDGKEIKEIKKNVKNLFLAYGNEKKAGLDGGISIPYKINGGYYLTSMMWPTNVTEMSQQLKDDFKREYAITIDIFDAAGGFVYSKTTEGLINPEIGKIIYSDSEGYLYTFKEMPYPQICKYEVIISDKNK